MPYKKIVAFLFLTFISANAQKKINQYDANGKRHGYWEKRYESGRVRYSGVFEHGKEKGEFLFYENKIINNFPTIKKVFKEDSDLVEVAFYSLSGRLKSKGQFKNKKREGAWLYYNGKSKVVLLENYKSGILNGLQVVYFDNGAKAEEKTYVEGKLNGLNTRYTKQGKKLHTMTYEDGKLHGRTTVFDEQGIIKESGLYFRDYKIGRWDVYLDGQYLGFKEPNKKKKEGEVAEESQINQIDEEIEAPVYSVELDEKLLKRIAPKMQKLLLLRKEQEEKFKKQDEAKKQKKKPKKLTDDEILKNIQGKKKTEEKKVQKLTDEEILENIQKKNTKK